MKTEVLNPHGMCNGVHAAVAAAEQSGGAYCLHSLVHNEIVVERLKSVGCRFVEDIEDVPDGETVVFSAHGVTPAIRKRADEKGLRAIDATCPFVARAHRAAREFSRRGLPVVVIGDPEHVEVKGIMGEIDVFREPRKGDRIGVVAQTTMDAEVVEARVDELRRDYAVEGVVEVCTATRERQDAVRRFDGDALIVLGSRKSANTRRLCEVAQCPAEIASDLNDVRRVAERFRSCSRVGLTSGASTPESFFFEALDLLRAYPATEKTSKLGKPKAL